MQHLLTNRTHNEFPHVKSLDLQNVISVHFHRCQGHFFDDLCVKVDNDAAAFVERHRKALLNDQLTLDKLKSSCEDLCNTACTTSKKAMELLTKVVSKWCQVCGGDQRSTSS